MMLVDPRSSRLPLIAVLVFSLSTSYCWARLSEANVQRDERRLQDEQLELSSFSFDVSNQYIVRLSNQLGRSRISEKIAFLLQGFDSAKVLFTYSNAFLGFCVQNMPPAGIQRLLSDLDVLTIEPVAALESHGTTAVEKKPPSWGLDRVDQTNLPLNQRYNYNWTGVGVEVFIVDTGIFISHQDFGARAFCGYNAFASMGEPCDDYDGHGTHVAGIVGGSTFGIAKRVDITAVKVLGKSGGSTATAVAGIDYIIERKQSAGNSVRMVANLSFGTSSINNVLNDAVTRAVQAGVVMVLSAGNKNSDACLVSPASASDGITVAATVTSDARAYYSSYGRCVDIFAPGDTITSAGISSTSSQAIKSGTSQAAPHVTGVVALYLERFPDATPQDVVRYIQGDGTPNIVTNPGNGTAFNVLLSTARFGKTSGSCTGPHGAFVGC